MSGFIPGLGMPLILYSEKHNSVYVSYTSINGQSKQKGSFLSQDGVEPEETVFRHVLTHTCKLKSIEQTKG